jgi:PAS domain S-box-containing protein
VGTRVQIGNEAFALIMGIDTTERMKAVAALQESEENYRGAITAAGLVPYVDDYETHQYSFMGENIFKITGYLAEEMTPAIFNAMIQENHTNELDDANLGPEEAAKRFLSGKVGKWSNDIRIRTRSGEERWLNDVSVPRVDEHGRATKAIGVIQDVTERKQAEALRIAAQAADATNEARSEFLTSMSHELRTPLNAIIGFSDMLEQQFYGPLNAKQAEYVQDINDSGQYLLSLINAILDLSKIEAGKMELDLSEVYLREILEQGLLMIREAANAHGLRVSLSVPPEVDELVIKADALKLKQIMFNLLSNAAKFTPDYGAIDITAWLAGGETESEPRRVEICVTDSGIGLEPGDLTRVFESFFQVKSAKRGKPQGTGLGLSLVKHMVELHGGKVWAESGGPGKGCRFIFTLPLAGNL